MIGYYIFTLCCMMVIGVVLLGGVVFNAYKDYKNKKKEKLLIKSIFNKKYSNIKEKINETCIICM